MDGSRAGLDRRHGEVLSPADAPPDQLGERQWMIGVYVYMGGKKAKEGRELLTQATQATHQHDGDLPLFPESGEAP